MNRVQRSTELTDNSTQDKPSDNSDTPTPQSPEKQAEYVREELDQDMITHQGDYRQADAPRKADRSPSHHLGATDDEVVPITPPMAGPADLVGKHNENAQGNETGSTELGEESIDPRDELTPG
jgi:hypothetical protein